jgi:hypothetical protein
MCKDVAVGNHITVLHKNVSCIPFFLESLACVAGLLYDNPHRVAFAVILLVIYVVVIRKLLCVGFVCI